MKKLVIVLVFFLFYVNFVSAIDIRRCGVLDEEGETYVLQNDVETEDICFRITADDITLDCNGYSITGSDNNYGIILEGGSGIIITNCEISGFDMGIAGADTGENEIINNYLHGNYFGILFDFSMSNTITNNVINENRIGIIPSDLNTITNNVINENRIGILIEDATGFGFEVSQNIIRNNIINENAWDGIHLTDRAFYNTITDNVVNENGRNGIHLGGYSNNIIGNTFCYNDNEDIITENEYHELLYTQCDNVEGIDIDCMPCDVLEHEIQLNAGWNLISSYLVPYFTDIEAIFGKLARQSVLIMVKDGQGRFYEPTNNFNNIPEWNPYEAYYVKVNEPTELIIKGEEYINTEIELREGWNYIAYPLDGTLDMNHVIENILAPLIEENILILMKNGLGDFFAPRYNFNNIEQMRPGEGYMIKVNEDVVLDFRRRNNNENVLDDI